MWIERGAGLPRQTDTSHVPHVWIKAGQPPDEYGARPLTPAAQPLACTRARRSTATETNSAIDRSVRALRDVTNIV